MPNDHHEIPALLQLAEELTGVKLLESGSFKPFFLLAASHSSKKRAYLIPVSFNDQKSLEFTSVKIAAILQSENCNHYAFSSTIQFKAQAGEKTVMKQQVILLFALKTGHQKHRCDARLYDLKLNIELGKPQLKLTRTIEHYDGQFSNLFDAPKIPDDLITKFNQDLQQYQIIEV